MDRYTPSATPGQNQHTDAPLRMKLMRLTWNTCPQSSHLKGSGSGSGTPCASATALCIAEADADPGLNIATPRRRGGAVYSSRQMAHCASCFSMRRKARGMRWKVFSHSPESLSCGLCSDVALNPNARPKRWRPVTGPDGRVVAAGTMTGAGGGM